MKYFSNFIATKKLYSKIALKCKKQLTARRFIKIVLINWVTTKGEEEILWSHYYKRNTTPPIPRSNEFIGNLLKNKIKSNTKLLIEMKNRLSIIFKNRVTWRKSETNGYKTVVNCFQLQIQLPIVLQIGCRACFCVCQRRCHEITF